MTNIEKYTKAFADAFNCDTQEAEVLIYQSIPAWDSIGHMSLITEIESAFEIMMDTEDIIDFSSFKKGKEILKKYDVEID